MSIVSFQGRNYSITPGESVLDALIRGGANTPFSCRKGTCQVCVLQVIRGIPGADSTKGLRQALVDRGLFLPCQAHPAEDIAVGPPDLSDLYVRAVVAEKTWKSDSICRLSFETETEFDWKPGQFVNVKRHDGLVRSYSISSLKEDDYFLSIDVQRVKLGVMSSWLLDDLDVGDELELRGPIGTCYYGAKGDTDILLVGTGSGLSPLAAICRNALNQGHRGKILLHYSARSREEFYLQDDLVDLAHAHSTFSHYPSLRQKPDGSPTVGHSRVVDQAFPPGEDRAGFVVYLCGAPSMVYEARVAAVAAGVRRSDIHADPFEYAHPLEPRDKRTIAETKAQPALWAALDHGPGLSAILTRFYDVIFEDQRLAPFFHKVTKQRAIEQQYSFLADLFTGRSSYFGLRPFNAHHWMVISDDLFDYREALMEDAMRSHGLPETAIRVWSAVHESFRREIVKSTPRGLIVDGEEQPILPPERVELEFAGLCDGCESEMPAGGIGTFVPRTGQLFCGTCAVRGETG